jgi:hypothetical protein
MESLITDMIAGVTEAAIIPIKNLKKDTRHRPAGSVDSYASFASMMIKL